MRVIVCKNYDEMSEKAAELVSSQVLLKPDCVLGLATGSTPIGMYERLAKMHKDGKLDFSEVTTFNLDEYYPISRSNDQSYYYFMNDNLFQHINVKPGRSFIPNGETDDPETECKNYDAKIDEEGGVDLQILGVGINGHIGFNEPDENLVAGTHLTGLTDNTIEANSRFFASKEDVPTKALTMGMTTILKSKKIVILASGKNKHNAVKNMLNDAITTSCPATLLKVHSDVVLICDEEAYNG